MQIVINIPKELYDKMKTYQGLDNAYFAIKHGTPLPKEHGRLIDADSFVQEHPLSFVRDVINNAPTIIEADKAESEE